MTDRQTPIPAGAIRHGECGHWWAGVGRAHCPAARCHRTFSCDSAAEKHRAGPTGARQCVDPRSVGLVAREMPFGVLWGWPAPEVGVRALRAGTVAP
jgi:hypothetical protein